MNDTTVAARLRAAANESLQAADGDISKAAAKLDRALAGKSDLRLALAVDYLDRLIGDAKPAPGSPAPELRSRRKKGVHRIPRGTGMPTQSQKAAELTAAHDAASMVFQRKVRGGQLLGQIRIRELRALVQESGHAAGSFVARGYEDAVDAILCSKLLNHCIATDPDALVTDCIKGTVATSYLKEAKLEAARFVQHAAARIADELTAPPAPPHIGGAP